MRTAFIQISYGRVCDHVRVAESSSDREIYRSELEAARSEVSDVLLAIDELLTNKAT